MLAAPMLATLALAQTGKLNAYAIVGATVTCKGFDEPSVKTILISNGKILEVGADLAVPPGFEVIDGKGLFAYPGFIDGGLTKGMKDPKDVPRYTEPYDTTADVSTRMLEASPYMVASYKAADYYDPDDATWATERANGFTSAVLMPHFGVVQGSPSFFNLNGKVRRDACIRPELGMKFKLDFNSGTYPGTPLGAFATARQALFDGDWIKQQHAKDPLFRPDDPELEALNNWYGRKVRLSFFDAESGWIKESCDRFATEFSLNRKHNNEENDCIFVGGTKFSELPKGSAVNLIAHVNFPKMPAADSTEPENIKAEKLLQWKKTLGALKDFATNDSYLIFSAEGCKDHTEFWDNLRLVVKAGLDPRVVLCGLTYKAAHLFKLDNYLGTIEKGKVANITLMTAKFLDENMKAKYVFVDGMKFDPNRPPSKFDNSKPDFGGDRG